MVTRRVFSFCSREMMSKQIYSFQKMIPSEFEIRAHVQAI